MEAICRVSNRISRVLQKIELILGTACLIALLLVMLTNAAARYLFDFPIIWSDEINNFFFVWMGFLSAAYIMGNDGHMRVTALTSFLPRRLGYAVGIFTDLVMLCVFAYMLPSLVAMLSKLTVSGLMRLPLKYVYAILPASFGLMGLHILNNMLQRTLNEIRASRAAGKEEKAWN